MQIKLRIREAKGQEFLAPSKYKTDNKNIFGWPYCLFVAYSEESEQFKSLICGGGQTEEEAIENANERIKRIGLSEFEKQSRKSAND